MGLMDRDYMKREERERPFSPLPERSSTSTLKMVLIFLAVLYGLFKISSLLLDTGGYSFNKPPLVKSSPSIINTEPRQLSFPPPERNQYNTEDARPGSRTITKCIVNGKTSYGDAGCPSGSTTTQVVTKSNHNLMAAIPVPVVAQAAEPFDPLPLIVQSNADSNYAAIKSECEALNKRIEYLDAMARQPLSGQTHDWIRDERKKARDRQFHIPCR